MVMQQFAARRMYRVLGLVCLAAVGCLPAQAQSSAEDDAGPALRPGAWALQFQVNPNFTLGNFQGTLISAKRHQSAKSAIRLGLSLDAAFDVSESDRFSFRREEDTIQEDERQSEQHIDRLGGTLVVQFLYYPSSPGDIRPFLGFGPRLSLARQTSETDPVPPSASVVQTRRYEDKAWAAGLDGIFGAEWFIRSNLSVTGEYGLSATFRHSRRTRTTRYVDENLQRRSIENEEDATRGLSVHGAPVKLGLSVYF